MSEVISLARPSLGKARRDPASARASNIIYQLLELSTPSRIQHQSLLWLVSSSQHAPPTHTNGRSKADRNRSAHRTLALHPTCMDPIIPKCPSPLRLKEQLADTRVYLLFRPSSTRSSTPSTSSSTKPSAPSSAACSRPRPRPSAFPPLPAMSGT